VTLPERDVAKGWQGRLVLDQDGERLGECTGIFADAASGATEWLEVAVEGHRRCLLPALNALEVGGQVRVAFGRAAVLAAPHVGDDTELSKRDDIVLYRHYGVHYSAAAQVAKPAQPVPVPVPPKAPVQGLAASMAGESSPGPTVPSQQAQPASASASPGADAPGSGAEPLGPLAGAWASGAPLVALAALAAAVAFGLRARDQRIAVGPTTSAGRRRRAAPSRTRTAPAARRRTGSTPGTSARKPRVRAAAGSAKHDGSVGRSVRRQLRRLATAGTCAAGYLRGARAGRQRYDQLRAQAEQLAQHPQVQTAKQAATDPQARKQALAQTRERYRSGREQYRSIRRQATELARHPQVQHYRQAVTDPQARQQVFTELRAHPQVRHYQQAVTDPQVRQQVLLELREKADVVAAALKKRLG